MKKYHEAIDNIHLAMSLKSKDITIEAEAIQVII